MTQTDPVAPRGNARAWLPALGILALAIAAHARAVGGGWIWDDDSNLTNNSAVQTWAGLAWIWLDPRAIQQYYPVTHTSFWIEHKLWGLNPAGYHAVNVLLHALNSLLLWNVFRRLGLAAAAAWIGAALFAVHPVHVETVAWVTERKNTLSMALYLASGLLWLRWDGIAEGGSRGRGSLTVWCGSFVTFLVGLLAKSVTTILPVTVLVLAWWKRGRVIKSEVLWLLPFYVAAIAAGLLTIYLERDNVGAAAAVPSLSLAQRVLLAGRAVWFYAAKLALPLDLNFVYPRWELDPSNVVAWLFPAGALAVVVALFLLRRRIGRGPLTAALVWGIGLAPMLGFISLYYFRYTFVSDHFLYHASAAPLALAGIGLARAMGALDRLRSGLGRVACAAILLALVSLSVERTGVFRDNSHLWADTLRKNPRAWMAWNNLGLETYQRGQLDEAETMFRNALAISDAQHEVWNNLGLCLMDSGRIAEAIEAFSRAVALRPARAAAQENLGHAWLLAGEWDRAATVLRTAVALPRHRVEAELDLVRALGRGGRAAEAEQACREGWSRFPGEARLAVLLGGILRHRGAQSEAAAVLEEMVTRSGRSDPVVLDALAQTYAEMGRFDLSARLEEEALALRPGPAPEAVLRRRLEAYRRSMMPDSGN